MKRFLFLTMMLVSLLIQGAGMKFSDYPAINATNLQSTDLFLIARPGAPGTNYKVSATSMASTALVQAGDAAVSNIMVSFTITTNLSYTNYLVAVLASNNNFNGTYSWTGLRYENVGLNKFITNNGGAFIFGSSAAPNSPTAFTNDTLTGQYDNNGVLTTAPYVFYPSSAVITTNWFVAGESFKLPLNQTTFEDYGARGDMVKLYAATVASGNLICTNAAFIAADVGKWAVIYSTPTNTDYTLSRIIAFNNATNVSLSTNYTQTTPYEAWYGTGNYAAISNALGSTRGDAIVGFSGQYGGNYLIEASALDPTTFRYAAINIPTDRSTGIITNTSRTIVIKGQTTPVVYPAFFVGGGATNALGTPNTGTILYNFAKPVSGSTNVFVYHDGTSAGGSQFARERVVWQDITLRQPGKPTHHGMYLARCGTTYLKRFQLDVDQSANWLNYTSGLPPFFMESIVSNANTIYGIYGPDPYNYAGIQLEDVAVAYHGTPYRLGEHTVAVGKTIAIGCGSLLYADGAFGSQGTYSGATFDFLYAYLCQHRIIIATNSTAREPVTVQNLLLEEGFPRADIGPLVIDPLKRGDINIQAITGNAQNTTIESTNGSWNNTILNYSYDRGVTHSNGVVIANGSGLTSLNISATTQTNVTLAGSNLVGGFTFYGAQIRSPNGSPSAVAFGNATNSGLYFGSGSLGYSASGTTKFFFQNSADRGLVFGSDMPMAWTPGTGAIDAAPDTFLRRLNTNIIVTHGALSATNGFITPPLVCSTATTNWGGQGLIVAHTNTVIVMSVTGQEGKRVVATRSPLNSDVGGQAILYCTNGSFFTAGSGSFVTNYTLPVSGGAAFNVYGTNFMLEY